MKLLLARIILVSLPLENAAGTHACANAHWDDTKAFLSALKLRHESADHSTTCIAERMAEGNCTSLWVQFLSRNTQLIDAIWCLRGKGFVDLEDVDVIHGETTSLKRSRDSKGRTNSHNLRWNTCYCKAHYSAIDTAAEFGCNISSRQKNCGCAISHLAWVSSCGCATFLEGRFELSKAFNGGGGTDSIVFVNKNLSLIAILVLDNSMVWSNLCLEKSFSSRSFLMRRSCQSVLSDAIDAKLLSDVFRSNTHRHEAVVSTFTLEDFLTKKVRIDLIHHICIGHWLKSATDTDWDLAGSNGISYCSDSLKTRWAQAVNCSNTCRLRVTCHEHCHTSIRSSRARV